MNPSQQIGTSPNQTWRERYNEVSKIGEGAFGMVYLATSLADPSQQVAVKVMNVSKEQELKILECETKCLRQLRIQRNRNQENLKKEPQNQPELEKQEQLNHLLELIEVIQTPGTNEAAIVMKYYKDSKSLTQHLANNKSLDDDTKLKYLLHIALGLNFMHSIGMYHRDLKLDNFLYVPETESIVIIDFGLAVMGKAEDTSSEQVGTKMFSSPQQLRMEPSSNEKNDVWALGVILYMMLYNKHPLSGDSNSLDVLVANASKLLSYNYEIEAPNNQPSFIKDLLSKTLSGREITRDPVSNIVFMLKNYFEQKLKIQQQQANKPKNKETFQYVQGNVENGLNTNPNQINPQGSQQLNQYSQEINLQVGLQQAQPENVNDLQQLYPPIEPQQQGMNQQSQEQQLYQQQQMYEQIQQQQQYYPNQQFPYQQPNAYEQQQQQMYQQQQGQQGYQQQQMLQQQQGQQGYLQQQMYQQQQGQQGFLQQQMYQQQQYQQQYGNQPQGQYLPDQAQYLQQQTQPPFPQQQQYQQQQFQLQSQQYPQYQQQEPQQQQQQEYSKQQQFLPNQQMYAAAQQYPGQQQNYQFPQYQVINQNGNPKIN